MALLVGVSGLLAGLFAWGIAQGTTFFERPFPETIENAPIVIRGVVTGTYTDWSREPGDQRIFTFYDLQVSEVFKGEVSGRAVLIRELGGENDGIGMQVAGAAQFARGDDVVVLLGKPNPDGSHPVRGMMMGRYDILRDENDREYLAGAGLHDPGTGADRHSHDTHGDTHEKMDRDASPPRRWTLQDLRQLVREQLQLTQDKSVENPREKLVVPTTGTPASEAQQAASQLQPLPFESPVPESSDSEGEQMGLPVKLAIALLGLGALGALIFGRRSRHPK
ncbi:MAG: hypothetical protein A2X94_14690 [Bdellovibrionales bacterium GWB1_55_8]|nr:MAG: hypothetical protein A2X94_14690 [Bdellovibrionales bacterium GWB1_55_8]